MLLLLVPGEYKLDDEVWAEVHDSAKDMISHMVVVDPSQRWSAKELLNHKWFEVRHLHGSLTLHHSWPLSTGSSFTPG